MTYDKTVHLRLTDKQIKYIDETSLLTGMGKSAVVRGLIDKAIKKSKKDGRKV